MRKLLILAGAAALCALPGAAIAKDNGNGHGKQAHGKQSHAAKGQSYDRYADRGDYRGRIASNGCPRGLAKKRNGCLPPGQAKRIGQRSPWASDRYADYNELPAYYRERYADQSGQRYYYEGNRVYTIDPTTNLIRSIINIIR